MDLFRRVVAPVILDTIWATRVHFVFVLIICTILSVGQGSELSISLRSRATWAGLASILFVGAFAAQVWLWANLSAATADIRPWSRSGLAFLRQKFGDNIRRGIGNIAGSLYATILVLFVTYQFWKVGEATAALPLAFTNILILIYLILHASRIASSDYQSDFVVYLNRLLNTPLAVIFRSRKFDGATPAMRLLLLLSFVASVAAYCGWYLLADGRTDNIGAFGSVFLAFVIIAPWAFLVFFLCQNSRLPIVFLMIVAPFAAETIYGWIGISPQRYVVREIETTALEVTSRPTLREALAHWEVLSDKRKQNAPIIFVTTSGGGIRAAYWSAAVLARLQDCIPDFGKQVFFISGVSGGSLGAAAFTTLLANNPSERIPLSCPHPNAFDRSRYREGQYQKFLQEFFAADFLAPVVRETLLGDLFRSIIPVSLGNSSNDRGVVLERAWEQAWQATCREYKDMCVSGPNLQSPLNSLTSQTSWSPLLLLNGVHQETGKRLITSTARISDHDLVDAMDFNALVRHEVRISTAVLNSARFPIISPSGALMRRTEDNKRQPVGHVIDGGYFDNNGTLTSLEAAAVALSSLKTVGTPPSCQRRSSNRRAIYIEILNDTGMKEYDAIRSQELPTNFLDNVDFLQSFDVNLPARQLLTAIKGLESTSSARAVHASKSLAKIASLERCDSFFQLRLCPGIIPPPALGWMLSRESQGAMDELILGGVRTEKYAGQKEFRDCYVQLQRDLQTLINMLR